MAAWTAAGTTVAPRPSCGLEGGDASPSRLDDAAPARVVELGSERGARRGERRRSPPAWRAPGGEGRRFESPTAGGQRATALCPGGAVASGQAACGVLSCGQRSVARPPAARRPSGDRASACLGRRRVTRRCVAYTATGPEWSDCVRRHVAVRPGDTAAVGAAAAHVGRLHGARRPQPGRGGVAASGDTASVGLHGGGVAGWPAAWGTTAASWVGWPVQWRHGRQHAAVWRPMTLVWGHSHVRRHSGRHGDLPRWHRWPLLAARRP